MIVVQLLCSQTLSNAISAFSPDRASLVTTGEHSVATGHGNDDEDETDATSGQTGKRALSSGLSRRLFVGLVVNLISVIHVCVTHLFRTSAYMLAFVWLMPSGCNKRTGSSWRPQRAPIASTCCHCCPRSVGLGAFGTAHVSQRTCWRLAGQRCARNCLSVVVGLIRLAKSNNRQPKLPNNSGRWRTQCKFAAETSAKIRANFLAVRWGSGGGAKLRTKELGARAGHSPGRPGANHGSWNKAAGPSAGPSSVWGRRRARALSLLASGAVVAVGRPARTVGGRRMRVPYLGWHRRALARQR